MPGASTEQVLEAELDLLLEKQARRKALVMRPRTATPTATPTLILTACAPMTTPPAAPSVAPQARSRGAPPPSQRTRTRSLPAAVEREVRLRDGDRCQHPLGAGGVCGSTWQVELDHVVPLALGGPPTVANLRCACRVHDRHAAELALGALMATRLRRRRH